MPRLLSMSIHGRRMDHTSAADLLLDPRSSYDRQRSMPIALSEGHMSAAFHSPMEMPIMAVSVTSLTNDITARKDRKHDNATTSFHPD
jgi:hypothetical protein